MKVNVLGTEYEILERTENEDENLADNDGYCDTSVKKCVIDAMNKRESDSKEDLEEYKKRVKRHELIHAFLYESGLAENCWAVNEEMVDWLAIQFPKLAKTFKEVGCE